SPYSFVNPFFHVLLTVNIGPPFSPFSSPDHGLAGYGIGIAFAGILPAIYRQQKTMQKELPFGSPVIIYVSSARI
ncbi:MAG: hypothetical protein IKI24_07790, partial [Clostridia bacterium]|nr:hypothetical protein [Clostridia bacterium]